MVAGLGEAGRCGDGPTRRGPGDYAAFYAADPTYGRFPQERRRPPVRHGAVPVDMLRAEQGEVDAVDPATGHVVVALAVDVSPRLESRFHCGEGWFGGEGRRGDIVFHPPDADVHCRPSHRNTLLLARLPLAPLASALEHEPVALARTLAPLHAGVHGDPLIEQLMRALWREAERDDPVARILVETATLSLGAALLTRAGAAAEHVEAHLAETLTLAEMAAVACLSPWHFNRAFKAATGLAPHRYVTARRVRRAERLLRETALPLTEIAYACGFASQSHFGEVFKRHTGTTPGAWRAEAAG